MEGGSAATISTVTDAIVAMAGDVATNALSMIAQILPVLAPVVAAIIIAALGYRLVKQFAG